MQAPPVRGPGKARVGVRFAATPSGQALRIALWQAASVAGLASASAAGWDARTGAGVLVGGVIAVLPTVYIALALLRSSVSGGAAPVGMHRVFVGWVIKNALTVALLVIAFRSRAFAPPALLAGVGVALVAYWLCMVFGRVKHANTIDSE